MDKKLLQAYLMGGISEERAKAWRDRKGYKDDAKPKGNNDPDMPDGIDPPNENEQGVHVRDGKLHMQVQGMICSGWIAEILEWFGDVCCNIDARVDELAKNPDMDVVLHIDSPGGIIYDGARLRSALQGRQANGKTITAIVEGEATSMACVIALVADKIVMESYAVIQFHTPIASVGFSDARELHRAARQLEAWEVIMADDYSARTSESAQVFLNNLRRDRLMPFSSKDASKIGLCDKVMDGTGEDADADPANQNGDPDDGGNENENDNPDGGDDDEEMQGEGKQPTGGGNKGAEPVDPPPDGNEGGGNDAGGGHEPGEDVPPPPAPPAPKDNKKDARAQLEHARTLASLGSLYPTIKRKQPSGNEPGKKEES